MYLAEKNLIVAISGWKKSGKDTLGSALCDLGFKRLAFADALKERCAGDYRLSLGQVTDQTMKESPLLDRPVVVKDDRTAHLVRGLALEFRTEDGLRLRPDEELLIQYDKTATTPYGKTLYWTPRAILIHEGGTKRAVDPDYWVHQIFTNKFFFGDFQKGRSAVITDLRFKNEAETLRQAALNKGFNLVLVRVNRFAVNPSTDATECDLDDYSFDLTIENTGTVDQAVNQLVNGLAKLTSNQ